MDKVSIQEATVHDLGVIAAIAPSGCELTNAESIEVWVVNNGLVDETGFDVSYGVNGGSVTTENISSTLSPGDTLMHVFAGTADMSTNYTVYDVALNVSLSTDEDSTNNNFSTSGKNFITPNAPSTTADTVCNGDTAHVMAMSSEGDIIWYDAMSGGNVVGQGDNLLMWRHQQLLHIMLRLKLLMVFQMILNPTTWVIQLYRPTQQTGRHGQVELQAVYTMHQFRMHRLLVDLTHYT